MFTQSLARPLAFLSLLLCNTAFGALTTDTGDVERFYSKNGAWWVELTGGMPNAVADRTCRLELFYTRSESVAEMIYFAIEHSKQVTIRSQRCETNIWVGDDAYHQIDMVWFDP